VDTRLIDIDSDAEVARFHEIGLRAETQDGRPWNEFATLEEMQILLHDPTPGRRADCIGVFDDGDDMVGGGMVQVSLEDNLDKAFLYACVEPERRGRGIGSVVVDALVEHAGTLGRTELLSGGSFRFEHRDDAPVLRFASRHGFSLANTEVVRECPLPVGAGLLDAIDADVAQHADGYGLGTFVDEMPDELQESYCRLLNQLATDAPTGEIDFEAESYTPEALRHDIARDVQAGRTVVRSLALLDGQVVAHSDLALRRPGDHRAQQWGTIVHRDHRGHRLGAAVKAANVRWLQHHRPDVTVITTENAEVNQQMIAINERLGFRPVALVAQLMRRLED
jgi:RimJ/RimL family protein N-acetyltransferase